MPKIVNVEEKRRQILGAAATVFARDGFRSTNMQRVAAEANMGKSSIYHYFATKQDLFEALVKQLLAQEEVLFDSLINSTLAPRERFDTLIDAVSAMFAQWATAGPLVIDFVREEKGRLALAQTIERTRISVEELVREGQEAGICREGNARALATLVIGCLEGLLMMEIVKPGSTAEAKGEFLRQNLSVLLFEPEEL